MKVEQRVTSLAWKALMNSFNLGLENAFSKSNFVRYTWVTPKKDNNCKVCKVMDGVELTGEQLKRLYPAHSGCVCFSVPKMEKE